MNCRRVLSNIDSFVNFQAPPEHMLQIEEHLNSCASCSKEYKSNKSLISLLNNTDIPRYSENEWSAIYENISSVISINPHQNNRNVITPFTSFFNIHQMPLKALAALFVISLISFTTITLFKSNRSYPKIVAIDGSAFSNGSTGNAVSRTPAQNNNQIPPGRSIETDFNSSVQIQIDKGSTIHLGRNSRISVANFEAKKTILSLKNGDILAQVSKRTPDQLFRIETPNAFCEVIGTRFNVTTTHDDFRNRFITTLIVLEGTVQFGSDAHHLPIKAGSAVAIFGDSMGTTTSIDDPLITLLQRRPGYGRYTIVSNPREAQVSIDGIPCGVTPFTGYLPYGNHTINCSKNSYNLWSGALRIDAQQQTTIEINLKQGTPETQHNPVLLAGNDTFGNNLLHSAIARINAGDYRNALKQLDKIIYDQSSSPLLRAAAFSKASMCYKYTGNYSNAVRMLGRIIGGQFPADQQELALFERATIYQTMLHDNTNAIADLGTYVSQFSNGMWAEEATISLADLQYTKSNFKEAAINYQTYCDKFTNKTKRENALIRLASIYSNNLNDTKRAFNTYNRFLLEFPNSTYAEDALYWSADCLLRQGKTSSALAGFSSYAKRYPAGKWHSEVSTRLKRFETAEVK